MSNKNSLVGAGAIIAILGSLSFLYFSEFRSGPKRDPKPFEHLGQIAAEETLALVGGSGRVALVTELIEITRSPNLDAQVAGFKAALGKQPAVTLQGVTMIKRPPSEDPRLWPADQVGQLAQAAEGAGALVLFMSLPAQLAPGDLSVLKGLKCKVLVVTGPSPVIKPLLQQGIIHAAIVNRFPPKPAPSGKETPRQWFDRIYFVAKPDALGELP